VDALAEIFDKIERFVAEDSLTGEAIQETTSLSSRFSDAIQVGTRGPSSMP